MFYDARLMKSKTIGRAWKSAHKFSESTKNAKNFGKTCTHLSNWVKSEHEMASRRLALRTSATLVSGAASLYKREVEELLADLQYTEDSMSRQSSGNQGQVSGSSCFKTQANLSMEHGYSSLARQSKDSNIENEELNPEEIEEMEPPPEEHKNGRPANNDQDASKTLKSYRQRQRSSTVKRKNASTQISLNEINTEDVDDSERGSSEPQPCVFAIIYESKKTAVPYKLMFSSINPEISEVFF